MTWLAAPDRESLRFFKPISQRMKRAGASFCYELNSTLRSIHKGWMPISRKIEGLQGSCSLYWTYQTINTGGRAPTQLR